jgi:hypothetical protein
VIASGAADQEIDWSVLNTGFAPQDALLQLSHWDEVDAAKAGGGGKMDDDANGFRGDGP